MTENAQADPEALKGQPSRLDLLEAFADGGEAFVRAVAPRGDGMDGAAATRGDAGPSSRS